MTCMHNVNIKMCAALKVHQAFVHSQCDTHNVATFTAAPLLLAHAALASQPRMHLMQCSTPGPWQGLGSPQGTRRLKAQPHASACREQCSGAGAVVPGAGRTPGPNPYEGMPGARARAAAMCGKHAALATAQLRQLCRSETPQPSRTAWRAAGRCGTGCVVVRGRFQGQACKADRDMHASIEQQLRWNLAASPKDLPIGDLAGAR